MGNCISLKKKKDVTREHPTVSRWLASCDFSSVPEVDDFSMEEQSQSRMVYESVLGEENTVGDYDGYITALENLESEDEASGEQLDPTAPSSSAETQHQVDSCTFADEESVYETSDEQVPNDPVDHPETPMYSARFTPSGDTADEEECDVVDEFAEWKTNYDARPICPLPTPLRKNLISPGVDLESLVDRRGKVRRTERVKLYLEEKRQHAQHQREVQSAAAVYIAFALCSLFLAQGSKVLILRNHIADCTRQIQQVQSSPVINASPPPSHRSTSNTGFRRFGA